MQNLHEVALFREISQILAKFGKVWHSSKVKLDSHHSLWKSFIKKSLIVSSINSKKLAAEIILI